MLPALLLGYFSLGASQVVTVELYRGAPAGEHRYWAVTDTFLDSTQADRPMGGLFTLSGGKGRTVLVRFADLDQAIPNRAKISKATLYLYPSSSEKPELASASVLKMPWGEGPMFTSRQTATVTRGAATWKQRRNGDGGASWQEAGALGADDAKPIPGAKMETGDTNISITGLAEAVQNMRDHWYENQGFALTFSTSCEFFSSQAKLGKPKLVVEYQLDSAIAGPDLSVQWIDRTPENPKDGEEVTYRAAVKNIGGAPAAAFSAQWTPGSKFPVGKALAPGEQTIVELKKTFRNQVTDHRFSPLQFRVFPAEADIEPNNDVVEIDENALPVAVNGAPGFDTLQNWARLVNETYFAQSRFSFAPEGVIERIRIVPDGANADYSFEWSGEKSAVRSVLSQLTGLKPMDGEAVAKSDGRDVPYSDPYAGISGFGDTRFDGMIPPGIPMLYVPVASPLFDNLPIEPTDLLSGTEVAAINSGIGKKGKERLGIVWDLPATIILRAVDMTGKPLNGAELSFFQLDDGKMPDTPTQTILTKEGGTVIVDNRDPIVSTIDKDALHQPKRSPFGALKADGSNGTILVRALVNGEVEWSWIKAWQLVDSYYRGNKAAAIVDVRFNAPSGTLDNATNLAKGRLATDSANSLPAKLAALTDDNLTNEASLGSKKGDWIEIDLGRDRPIGEVRLVFKNPTMPGQYDIQLYATGQQPPDTDAWVKDLDFKWTLANRGVKAADGTISIPYRGPLTRSRYIRIVNRSGGEGQIAEIKVIPLKAE